MNNKQIILAAVAAISAAPLVQADVTVTLTGSSAFRASTVNAVLNLFSPANGGTLTGYGWGGATSFTSSNYHIFKGTVSGISGTVTVKTQWSGSAAGIRDVSNGNSIGFLPDSTSISPTGVSGAVTTSLGTQIADITMADNLQASTSFTTNALTTQNKVGIIPFAFVIGKDGNTNVKNITPQFFKSLATNGSAPASQATGNASDTQILFLGGRDNLSGTRITTLAETGYGTATPVTQYIPTVSSNIVSSVNLTSDGGNGGETSGGNLVNYTRYTTTAVNDNSFLSNHTNGTSMGFVAYMGENDSYAAVYGVGGGTTATNSGNGRYLTYNGVKAFDGVAKRPGSVVITNVAGKAVLTLDNSVSTPVVNQNNTTGLVLGQIVSGNNITGGSVIQSIDSATQITLDKPPLASATSTNIQIGALIPAAIRNGYYTFWNYEYIGYKAFSGTNPEKADKASFATKLENRIKGFDYGFSGLADDGAMKVFRTTDGGVLLAQ